MGQAKKMQQEAEEKREAATEIALRAGSLDKCEPHEVVLDNLAGAEPAYELGASLIADGDPLVDIFDDETDLRRSIDELIESTGEECASCAKNMED